MLLFSTILEVKDWVSFDDFIRLVLEWNEGSKYAENRVVGIDWHGEHCARYGESNLWLEMVELSEEKVLAIRHEKITADGVAWDSDFVLNLSERRISVRLDRTYREEALVIGAKYSTPHFITLLIEHGFVRDDGELPVLRTPMYVSDEHLPICENVFRNMGGYRLPVVFVSKTANDDDPLSVAWLASRLKGAAHVLVEESMERCREIRRRFFRAEMPYGAVRIFYPSETVGKKKFFFRSATGDMDRRLENVIQNVIYYGISQRIDRLFTWQGVSGAVLHEELRRQIDVRKNAENARQEAEEEVARVYETFGDDL